MRKRILIAIGIAWAVLAAGCAGGSAGTSAESAAGAETVAEAEEAPADTETGAEDPAAADSGQESKSEHKELVKYENGGGWFVEYDADQFTVTEEGDDVIFTYAEEGAEGNQIRFRYFLDEMPDEALYNAMAGEDGLPEHARSEGYFAGRSDVWALQARVLNADGTEAGKQYTAVEHNGGTLIVEVTTSLPEEEEAAMRITETIASVLDSFTFTEHEPQQMYAYIPGTYKQILHDQEEGSEDPADYYVQLNEDHTGVVHLQDEIPIIWYSREGKIFSPDSGEQIYEYSIEGDLLYLWEPGSERDSTLEFEKNVE